MTNWNNVTQIRVQDWTCGYCGREVSSSVGWRQAALDPAGHRIVGEANFIALCPRCDLPTLLDARGRTINPLPLFGSSVEHLPPDIDALYTEARHAMQGGAPTAAAMAGRKILMNVAVLNEAKEGQGFAYYVDWLVDKGLVTPQMREWVDEIRELGNDANHEIDLMTPEAAAELLSFVEMMLRVVYEYPERGRLAMSSRKARDQARKAEPTA